MLKKRFVSIVVVGLFFISVHVAGALAGIEPSPFQPEINQLGAVVNILQSADYRVVKTISHPPDPCFPPDPCEPGPDLNGAVNKLGAINRQLISVDDMVFSMIEEVMEVDPTPFRSDLIPALQAVGDASQAIADAIRDFTPPDPCHPDFITALGNVEASALCMTETVMWGIDEISAGLECSSYTDQRTCENAECFWSVDISGVYYCTD